VTGVWQERIKDNLAAYFKGIGCLHMVLGTSMAAKHHRIGIRIV
jgi:hypothetical protein